MTVADNDFREVVQAVRAILDSATLNQERRRCTEKIESLKEGDASISIPIAFKLLLQEDKQVSHVGWNIVEHVIRYKWADLPGDLRVTIRDGVLEHLSNGRYSLTSADLSLKTAISRSMVAMMEQEWPQNWPELFAQFKNIVLNETLFPQAQMVFIVLKRLIENVITYATISNPMRRRELSTSVNTIMPELLSMTIGRIRICIAQGVNDNSILVAKAGIDLLSESVDWVVGRVLEEVVDGIIEVLCAYLRTEAYGIYEDAALCLFKIASRKRAKNDETPIVVSMFKDAPMDAILSAARMAADVSSSNEGHYKYLKALCDLLTALGVHLSEIWSYIKNPPPNFANYLREISYYFVHPSMRIRSEVALVLVTFASHEHISMTEEFIQCVKLLIPNIPKNIEKSGSLTDVNSMTSHYARMDYEDDVAFMRDFMQLRDRVCRFTRESAEAHSAQFVSQINEWIARIISNPTVVSDTEFECIKRYLTAIVPALYRPIDGKVPKEIDDAFVYNFNVLMNCLQSVGSPNTVNLMLSIPSSFLQIFENHSELLPPFFEQLRRILMIDVASQDVITLKRHAISLMLKVSSSMPKVIEPYAQFVFEIVTNTAPHVTVIQRATLVQVLGALSNLVPRENKLLFLQSAISANVEFFASERLMQTISSVGSFMNFIGLTSPPELDDNTNSQYFTNRLDLKAHLCAIDGVLQQVNVPENESNPLFQLLGPLLPTFFQLAHCINCLSSPSSIELINNGFDRSVIDIGSHERHLIYCAVMEAESQETEEFGSGISATEKFRRYIADITDMAQSIIGLFGSQLYYDFYRLPTVENLLGSLINDLDYIIDFRMRFWIRRTFKSLIVSCPKGLENSIIQFTSGFTNHMRARLKARWDSIAVVDYDAEPTKEEIFLEHMTYVLSREYASFLKYAFLGEFNVSKDDNRKSPQEVITSSGSYLLKDRSILTAVIATLCTLLNCNDTQTALKIIPVTRIVFGTTFGYFDDEMSSFIFIKAIQSLQVHGADEVALGPLLSLIYQIYTSLRPQHAALIEILRQVPETTPEGIAAFDERIVTMSSQTDKIVEKHRREIMKKILRPVIAMSKKEKESPESDVFINIRRISADVEEHVDLVNNLAEQLEASERVSDDLETCKKFPDWKLRLKTRIICELTDSIIKFDSTLKSLSTVINELSKFFEERLGMMVRQEMRACRMAAKNETCRVCSEKAHGFHFGVLSCRACSAFFRRTVALNMQYHCRFDNKCVIDKSVRCMCRSCRHEKCLEVGMKAEYVQLNRDSIKTSKKPKEECEKVFEVCSPPHIVTSPSDSERSLNLSETELELFNRINVVFEDAIQNPKTSKKLSVIEMFRVGLNHLRKRRLMVHHEKFIDLEPYYGKEEFMEILKDNWDMVTAMSGREVELYAELLSFVKPFVDLPANQRWALFRHFTLSFMRFERTYETYRVCGGDPEDSEISFNGENMNFISALMREAEPLKAKHQRHTIVSIFGPGSTFIQRGLLVPMTEIKLSEIEFAALSLHLLWLNPCSEDVNKETEKHASYWRRQTFNDLHDYYINSLFMSNYAIRLGDFMALMSTLEKVVSYKKENIVIADLFTLAKVHPALFTLSR